MGRIVILGDSNSIWIQTYVSRVTSGLNHDFFVLSENDLNAPVVHSKNNCTYLSLASSEKFNKVHLGSVYYAVNLLSALKKLKNIDCIHVQFVNNRKLLGIRLTRHLYKKVIYTFWGSDLYRLEVKGKKALKNKLKFADIITVGSWDMKDVFERDYPEYADKVRVVRYGVNGLEPILRLISKKKEIKEEWNISEEQIVITIGYNGAKKQNHKEVLNEIEKVASTLRNRMFIVIPMTYGAQNGYVEEIEKTVEKTGIQYKIIVDYMDSETIAKLCTITDIFIHAQPTDALSASVQEQLCASSLLINPSWINYIELKKNGVYYWEYDNYYELPGLIEKYYLNDKKDIEERLKNNKQIIYDMSSWDVLKENWEVLYNA